MFAKWPLAVAAAVGVLGFSGSGTSAVVSVLHHSATLRFGGGHETLAFRMREPAGAILLYRVSAPKGTRVRGSAQLSGATVPLRIATTPVSRGTGCSELVDLVICTFAEQACPMPPGLWRFRFEKLDGPAAEVRVEFEVDTRQPSGRVE